MAARSVQQQQQQRSQLGGEEVASKKHLKKTTQTKVFLHRLRLCDRRALDLISELITAGGSEERAGWFPARDVIVFLLFSSSAKVRKGLF